MKRFSLLLIVTVLVIIGSSEILTSQAEKLFWINLGI